MIIRNQSFNLWTLSATWIESFLSYLSLTVVWAYRILLSPFLGGRCRFEPSCSCYAEQAFKKHTFRKAAVLVARRLGQCRPYGRFGLDPVPHSLDPKIQSGNTP